MDNTDIDYYEGNCVCKKKGIRHFLAALGYSLCGLREMMRETAFLHELILVFCHLIALFIMDVHFLPAFVLSSLLGVVLIVEMLNTAIESVVDMASPSFHYLAKRAKDLGSAAVFSAISLFLVGWIVVLLKGQM